MRQDAGYIYILRTDAVGTPATAAYRTPPRRVMRACMRKIGLLTRPCCAVLGTMAPITEEVAVIPFGLPCRQTGSGISRRGPARSAACAIRSDRNAGALVRLPHASRAGRVRRADPGRPGSLHGASIRREGS